jgi:tetratricopeptide (TPR) repeat protein
MKKIWLLLFLTILLTLPVSNGISYSAFAEEAKPSVERADNPEARELCLKGEEYLAKFTARDVEKAIEHFEEAIEKDPEFVMPYVNLSNAYVTMQYVTPVPSKEVMPKATELALKALEIDDTNGDAHGMLGWIYSVYDWDWDRGEREYKRAIELNPQDLYAHEGYALVLAYAGRFEEALKMANRTLELHPQTGMANMRLGGVLFMSGKYDEATKHLQKSVETFPDYIFMRLLLGNVYLEKAMYGEALKAFQAEKDKSFGPVAEVEVDSWIGIAHALMGEKDKAKKILADLEEKSKETYVPSYFIARLYFIVGDNDTAYQWLDRAYEERDAWLCEMKTEQLFDKLNLRSDPRHQAMLKKINLAD